MLTLYKMENEELNMVDPELDDDSSCTLSTKPAKPAGMSINAYCPCKNGVWGDWVDPHVAP